MEEFWNIIHFFAFTFLNKASRALDKISPFTLMLKIPVVEKFLIKRGGSVEMINKASDDVVTNPLVSVNSFYSGLIMHLMLVVFLFGMQTFYFVIFNNGKFPPFEVFVLALFVNLSISFLLNYFLLFRKDKYLRYFKKFKKKPRAWKVKWGLISAGVVLFPFLVLAGSFVAMSK